MTASINQSLLPDDYLPYLDELNRIVNESGDKIEGGLFYYHHSDKVNRHNIYDYFYNKRCNFASACKASKRMLEIGVNAGHSALLALSCGIEYHGVDICQYRYTQPAADFLKRTFGNRFHFYKGDSRQVVPAIHAKDPYLRFDLLHIDGHHGLDFCRADTENAIKMAYRDAWLLIDDTDMKAIGEYYLAQIQEGRLIEATPSGWVDNKHHKIARVAA
jgi:hypothetical protein